MDSQYRALFNTEELKLVDNMFPIFLEDSRKFFFAELKDVIHIPIEKMQEIYNEYYHEVVVYKDKVDTSNVSIGGILEEVKQNWTKTILEKNSFLIKSFTANESVDYVNEIKEIIARHDYMYANNCMEILREISQIILKK